ncbi:tetratricopeptide (TPR) repeat protein [Rhizobium sp. BK529]|uniref:hypothetical protein n=1 Tax=Rhizobium sp. BK529 TaxID=2586983 RepID=UPI001610382D|nr:hypothetical protein [Rhizobium sp. BK529]MBB3594838.1 tetratricopeptide (TPR) repeat protein [Rhizobium sp. BK529]
MRVAAVENQVRRIVADFNAGRLDQAMSLRETSLRQNRSDPTLNHLFAAILFGKGDAAKASIYIEMSLADTPDNAPGRLLAGRIARSWRDFDRAIFHLSRAATLSPSVEILLEQARTFDVARDRNRAAGAPLPSIFAYYLRWSQLSCHLTTILQTQVRPAVEKATPAAGLAPAPVPSGQPEAQTKIHAQQLQTQAGSAAGPLRAGGLTNRPQSAAAAKTQPEKAQPQKLTRGTQPPL